MEKDEWLQSVTSKEWLKRPKVELTPYLRKQRLRADSFWEPVIWLQNHQLHTLGYVEVFGTDQKFKRIPRTQWPPEKGHPVYGWRAQFIARSFIRKAERYHWMRPFTWKNLCSVERGKKPFSLGLLKEVIDQIEYSRAVRFRYARARHGRKQMQISFTGGLKLSWKTPGQ